MAGYLPTLDGSSNSQRVIAPAKNPSVSHKMRLLLISTRNSVSVANILSLKLLFQQYSPIMISLRFFTRKETQYSAANLRPNESHR